MTLNRIKELREICTNNYGKLEDKNLFSIILSDRDINGGLDFEMEMAYYNFSDGCWKRRYVIEETLQPPFGVNPKFCVKSISGANRAKFICCGSRLVRLPPW